MKNKKDIGNLHNAFGKDLDPSNTLSLHEDKEKGQQAYYKGQPMKYMDYMSEIGVRVAKGKRGKGYDNTQLFRGVKFNKKGKIIKRI